MHKQQTLGGLLQPGFLTYKTLVALWPIRSIGSIADFNLISYELVQSSCQWPAPVSERQKCPYNSLKYTFVL